MMSEVTTQQAAKKLAENNGNDAESLAAWVIGYTQSLENELNDIRALTGGSKKTRLIDELKRQVKEGEA